MSGRSTAVLLVIVAGVAGATEDRPLERLGWLAGCWQSERAEPGSGEQWMPPAGGTMLGMSRTVRRGETVEHEFMLLRALADGTLVFTAQPSGQMAASFRSSRITPTEAVFENEAHDFPQRISYRREGRSRLVARIDGVVDGVARSVEFPMSRGDCERPAIAPEE